MAKAVTAFEEIASNKNKRKVKKQQTALKNDRKILKERSKELLRAERALSKLEAQRVHLGRD